MTVSFWRQEPSLVTKVPSVGCVMDEEKRGILNPSWPAGLTVKKSLMWRTWSLPVPYKAPHDLASSLPPATLVSLLCLQWAECPLPHTFLLGSPPVRPHFLLSMAGSFLLLGCQAECHVPLSCIHFRHSTMIAIGQLLIVLYLFPNHLKCVLFTAVSLLCPPH